MSLNRPLNNRGFTIIEVMIVLAIAGIILLIVFLAVPTAERSARNYDRKNYASLIDASLIEYYNNTGHFPGGTGNPMTPPNQAEICTFLKSLPRVTPGAPCNPATTSCQSGTTVQFIQAGSYTVCYEDWNGIDHTYIGPDDEISITLAHWCDTSGAAVLTGNDTQTLRFVLWTPLEGISQPLCLDNFPG